MSEKLKPIELIRAITDPDSVKAGTPLSHADQQFQKTVIEKARILLAKYQQRNPSLHWTKNQEKNMRIGMSGQVAFQELLEYLKIPHDADDPSQPVKPYDFKLDIGTVEVKAYDYYCQKAIIKEGEWKGNDFLVVWQFTDSTGNRIIFKGWLTKKEVEAHPITPKGESKYTPEAEARVIDMTELREPKTFLENLRFPITDCESV